MMHARSRINARLLVAGLGLAIVSTCANAQPQDRPSDTPPSEQHQEAQSGPRRFDGSRLRESLKKAIDDMKQAQQDAEASLAKLENGTAPVEVAHELSPELRRFLRENLPGAGGGPIGPAGPGNRMRGGPDSQPDGPRGPRDRMNDGPEPRRPLGPEARAEALRQLREHAQDIADDIENLRKEDERMADGLIQRIIPRMRDAKMLKDRDPEMFRLKMDEVRSGINVLRAIREFRQAKNMPEDNADMQTARKTRMDAAETQLRTAVSDTLDVRLKLHERELTMLERRVEDVRKDIDEKRSKKSEGVDKLVERIKKGDMPPGLLGPDGPKPMRGEGPGDRPGPR